MLSQKKMEDYYASNYFTFVAFPFLQLEKFLAGSPDEYTFEDVELLNATHVIVFGDHIRHVKLVLSENYQTTMHTFVPIDAARYHFIPVVKLPELKKICEDVMDYDGPYLKNLTLAVAFFCLCGRHQPDPPSLVNSRVFSKIVHSAVIFFLLHDHEEMKQVLRYERICSSANQQPFDSFKYVHSKSISLYTHEDQKQLEQQDPRPSFVVFVLQAFEVVGPKARVECQKSIEHFLTTEDDTN
jgi:hypothetical protein